MAVIAPCLNCKDRFAGDKDTPNCHVTCAKYLEFVKDNQKQKDFIKKKQEEAYGVTSQMPKRYHR